MVELGPKPYCPTCEAETPYHRRRIFLLSMGDIFDPNVPTEWKAMAWDTVRRCQNVNWLVVSKRMERFRDELSACIHWNEEMIKLETETGEPIDRSLTLFLHNWVGGHSAPHNVWMISSAENQETLEKTLGYLLDIPCNTRGLSVEPMLGPVDLPGAYSKWLAEKPHYRVDFPLKDRIKWVIVGGESGYRHQARPCHAEWIQRLKLDCVDNDISVFVKQMGTNAFLNGQALKLLDRKGEKMHQWPEYLRLRQYPD